jgi:hypothetical protein
MICPEATPRDLRAIPLEGATARVPALLCHPARRRFTAEARRRRRNIARHSPRLSDNHTEFNRYRERSFGCET